MKFKSWLATLIIGSNIVLPCNNTYSLSTTDDFMEAMRLTAVKMNEPQADTVRLSLLYQLLIQMFACVAFCNHKGLAPEDFLQGVAVPEQLKKKDILSRATFKDKFKLNLILPKDIDLHASISLLSTILGANLDAFNQMFLVNSRHTNAQLHSAVSMCFILNTFVANV